MQLLLLKSGTDYLRILPDSYQPCTLDKASVFPMDRLEEVRNHARRLGEQGFAKVAIRLLYLEEKPFWEAPEGPTP